MKHLLKVFQAIGQAEDNIFIINAVNADFIGHIDENCIS